MLLRAGFTDDPLSGTAATRAQPGDLAVAQGEGVRLRSTHRASDFSISFCASFPPNQSSHATDAAWTQHGLQVCRRRVKPLSVSASSEHSF